MVKINDKHQPLYTSKKRYVYEKGGRGSGKSFAVTDYCIRISYDKGRVILFLRYTMVSAGISIVPEFESAMDRLGASDHFEIRGSEIINKLSGSKIIFKGVKTSSLNQTANLKSIQGLTDVIYDEFEEHPDQDSFDKLDESIRDINKDNRLVLVSNALHKESWQSKQFWHSSGLYYPQTEHIQTNYFDNLDNVSDSWLDKVNRVKETNIHKYDRDFLGLDYQDVDGALWKYDLIELNRVDVAPELKRIIVAIDPSVTSNKDSDETGLVVVGVGFDDRCYVLEDCSSIMSPQTWALKSIELYHKYKADRIIAEVNNGGDLVKTVIHNIDKNISYKSVRASRGKVLRAEPVLALYEEGMVRHVGTHAHLENQMTTWNAKGGDKSPDRIDALVWGVTELTESKNNWTIA
jgi:phage terminase large subunit-like protein